jgi:hypothetical protein
MNKGVVRTHKYPILQHQPPAMNPSPSHSQSDLVPDLANNVNYPVPGWPRLARIVAEKPDLESFPTFADLSIKSLLYYQAELIYLRKELHEAEWEDHRHPEEPDNFFSDYSKDLDLFILGREQALYREEEPPRQWVILERIRTTLEKYRKLVLNIPPETQLMRVASKTPHC